MNRKNAVLPWVVSAILMFFVLVGLGNGASNLNRVSWNHVGVAAAEELSVRKALPEELPQATSPDRKYYMLECELTNQGDKELALESYTFAMEPVKGERFAVRIESESDSAAIAAKRKIPEGCTGKVALLFSVEPEYMKNNQVRLIFEPYGEYTRELGVLELPE